MNIIIDYGMGNLGSIANMIAKIGANCIITSNKNKIEKATKIILPGVGAFDNGMKNLNKLGIIPLLNHKAFEEKTPTLGICLGMQLMTASSEEGNLPGLSWINAKTIRFKAGKNAIKIPHMGWNTIQINKKTNLLKDLNKNSRFYFVHSFYVECNNKRDILTTTRYGNNFTSVFGKNNIFGVQFHPEKSHRFGMQLLSNFLMS